MATRGNGDIRVANLSEAEVQSIVLLEDQYLPDRKEDLNILVLGRVGSGKSTLINMLFRLRSSDVFEETCGAESCKAYVVKKCKVVLGSISVNVYDTAGLFDVDVSLKSIVKQIRKEFKGITLHLVYLSASSTVIEWETKVSSRYFRFCRDCSMTTFGPIAFS